MLFLGRALRIFGSVTCAVWLVGGPSAAQNPVSPASNSNPTFYTSSNLVVVNVVVSDRDGKPILGLRKEDFELIEDGKVQSLQVFESHVASSSPSVVPDLHATPHENTSSPKLAADGAINVILFDMLNTPAEDQNYARQQMIEFLRRGMPIGQRVALFVLGNELRMLGIFMTPTPDWVAAAYRLQPNVEAMLDTHDEQWTSSIYSGSYEWNPNGKSPLVLLQDLPDPTRRWRVEARVQQTFDAMGAIAHALADYPERKNLLWLSEGFPGTMPLDHKEARFESRDYLAIFQKYSGQLESSQISIYPIDARGAAHVGLPGIDIEPAVFPGRRVDESLEAQRRTSEIAAQTGGRAFYNTNDLKAAMLLGVEHGANYYTLAYLPRNQKWNGAFRRITVKINRPRVRLDYREGYYGTKDRMSQTSH